MQRPRAPQTLTPKGLDWAKQGCKGLLVPLLLDPASWSLCVPPGKPFHSSVSVDAEAQNGGKGWHHILLPLISVTPKLLPHPSCLPVFPSAFEAVSKGGHRMFSGCLLFVISLFAQGRRLGAVAPAPGWSMPEFLPPTSPGHS